MERLVNKHFKEVLSEIGEDLPIDQRELIYTYLCQTHVYISFVLDDSLPVIKPRELDTVACVIDVLENILDRLDALDNVHIREWVDVNVPVTREAIKGSREYLKGLFTIRDEYFKLLEKTKEASLQETMKEQDYIEYVANMRAKGLDGQA